MVTDHNDTRGMNGLDETVEVRLMEEFHSIISLCYLRHCIRIVDDNGVNAPEERNERIFLVLVMMMNDLRE